MDIRTAILKAAAHIELKPDLYNFSCFRSPPAGDCGTPACMWGWIGFFLGQYGQSNMKTAFAAGEESTGRLYEFVGNLGMDCFDPADAAEGLRLYADKYHPAKPEAIPASCLAIFDMPAEELSRALEAA